jgi:hypothetical protein
MSNDSFTLSCLSVGRSAVVDDATLTESRALCNAVVSARRSRHANKSLRHMTQLSFVRSLACERTDVYRVVLNVASETGRHLARAAWRQRARAANRACFVMHPNVLQPVITIAWLTGHNHRHCQDYQAHGSRCQGRAITSSHAVQGARRASPSWAASAGAPRPVPRSPRARGPSPSGASACRLTTRRPACLATRPSACCAAPRAAARTRRLPRARAARCSPTWARLRRSRQRRRGRQAGVHRHARPRRLAYTAG